MPRMADFNPRATIARLMNMATGVADTHLPLQVADAVAKLQGRTL
jgi:hypothetical protein